MSKEDTPHHLYGIYDTAENDDVMKFGISGEELNQDGSSRRANKQVNYLNRAVGWLRFYAHILLKNISGRKEAERLEEEYIADYEQKHGTKPRGNP